jgi:hypothetical protein
MTAIVGVLNSQGIAIAADSAVTVTGNNGKKVYNRSNKIFTLSKFHPVGIAIYSNADFLGIPLETLIKLYRQKIKDVPFKTLKEYKLDFLDFIKAKVGHIHREYKRDAFYNFCFESYDTVKKNIIAKLNARQDELSLLPAAAAVTQIDAEILAALAAQLGVVQAQPKAAYVDISMADFVAYYQNDLAEIANYLQTEIQKVSNLASFKANHVLMLHEIFYELVNMEFIFERHSGLVFIGFGDDEIYPSSQLVLLGTLIADKPRLRFYEANEIIPGKLNSNILPYVQGDVTTAVLTGVDPNYKKEVKDSIKSAFDTISTEIANELNDPARAQQIATVIDATATQLSRKLDDYQFNTITGPLLEILAHMGKEDMSELAESLVNITSLKRKFTSSDSSDESVGGPVDVAIITKGDGFIWMKRKQYFNINDNKGFVDKYYKL